MTEEFCNDVDCQSCLGLGWVCEDHPNKPWHGSDLDDDPRSCRCQAAGALCPGELSLRA